MKCLKKIDASYTSIEQLTDSIGHLKELVDLDLYKCKKLRKLPEQIGNMESLRFFDASYSAIEHLPDTFTGLVNLDKLHLRWCENLKNLANTLWKLKVLRILDLYCCSKLEQLPEQLGKMQCLEKLNAPGTTIEGLPVSIGLLNMLEELNFACCTNFRNLPSSIWNLTSLERLSLDLQNMDTIILPDMVKDMKLKYLSLSCNVSLWLPVIQSLSSLVELNLYYESRIFSANEVYSLSKLAHLQSLTLHHCTSRDLSFSEFPVNVTNIMINNATAVEILPELSSLKQLKILNLWKCISLQSIPQLPPHLQVLELYECTSLQDLPDLSMLKELKELRLRKCCNLKSISLRSFLQVGQHELISFEADISDREVAEWFSYKSTGNTLSFTIPGDNLFRIGLWIVYNGKCTHWQRPCVRAAINNKTQDIKMNYYILLPDNIVAGEVRSRIECIKDNRMKSGDRIKISFRSEDTRVCGKLTVKMCGAHLLHKTPSPS